MIQAERALNQEVMMRLRALKPDCVVVPIPNSIYFPARSEAERKIISRVIAQMKNQGQLLPGAPDLIFANRHGTAFVELKKPASKLLFGKTPKGRLSDTQSEFMDKCIDVGVPYFVCHSWAEVFSSLSSIGII